MFNKSCSFIKDYDDEDDYFDIREKRGVEEMSVKA